MRLLHQDEHVVAVDKPAGWLVHRGWARDGEILMLRVRDAIGARVYPVHRIDRGASGVVVFALSSEGARALCQAFESGAVAKRYLALVRGNPPETGVIDHPIVNREGGERVAAVTEIDRLGVAGRYAVVEARPRTGRLHQIRRHLKHISCPLIGDVRYGKGEHNRLFRERYNLHRLALHALEITFPHPATGAPTTVAAPLAADLAATFAALEIDLSRSPAWR